MTGARTPLSKRARILILSAISLSVLVLVALLLPVPFIRLAPGPTYNVIGERDGEQIIAVTGTQTYPTSGELQMTTVLESGGPRGGLTFVGALASWFKSTDAVVPRELIYPDDISGEDVRAEQAALFNSSESDAIAAAMAYLDEPVTTQVVVNAVYEGTPAAGVLESGDIVIALDGIEVTDVAEVGDAIRNQPVGTSFTFTVQRDSQEQQDVQVVSAAGADDARVPYIGIGLGTLYAPGFDVQFNLDDIGGPSAGLVLAMGLIDKLTPGNLTDGRLIAGTGTIAPDGAVGPIGGIRQKLSGAREGGAGLFLMPKQHCAEAAGHVPNGLTVSPVGTLADAMHAVEAWTAGRSVAACPTS